MISRLSSLFILLAVVGLVMAARPKPVVTTIYIVRHAEKDLTPGLADPPLTAVGEARALALRDQLKRRKPAVLFTTDTKRTRATVAPLATAAKLTPQVYDPRQPATLASLIRRDYTGKAVVVVGHSNTLLPLVEALGAKSSVAEIKDEEFDYLFTVSIPGSGTPTVSVSRYGARR
jgi:phosphohistidine phosphatase SixA